MRFTSCPCKQGKEFWWWNICAMCHRIFLKPQTHYRYRLQLLSQVDIPELNLSPSMIGRICENTSGTYRDLTCCTAQVNTWQAAVLLGGGWPAAGTLAVSRRDTASWQGMMTLLNDSGFVASLELSSFHRTSTRVNFGLPNSTLVTQGQRQPIYKCYQLAFSRR